jgi:spore germination protein
MRKAKPPADQSRLQSEPAEAVSLTIEVPDDLDKALDIVRAIMCDCDDLQVRKVTIGERGIQVAVLGIEGIDDSGRIDVSILRAIAVDSREAPGAYTTPRDVFDRLYDQTLNTVTVHTETDIRQMIEAMLRGRCAIIVDGVPKAITADVASIPGRNVSEPTAETIIQGPRESFVERQNINTAMVRKHLHTPDLKLKRFDVGSRGKNAVAVMHIAGVTNPALVEEVYRRIEKIEVDAILSGGIMEQFIEDDWLSIFPQMATTERPDAVVTALLQGRVAIFTGNTPLVLVVPTTLDHLMHSPEDLYQRWQVASSVRVLRAVAVFLSLTLPSFYIALTSYHAEMIPTTLALAIGASRQAVPFPAFLEAFVMESALELLREAGIRLPTPIGQTIGIVGGLVVGEAAVRANLVSPTMVIVVALTAISSFAIPHYPTSLAFRLGRFFLMMLSSALGLYGLVIGLMIILSHLSALESFGVSYLAPWAPFDAKDIKNTLLRFPLHTLTHRPSFLKTIDQRGQSDAQSDRPKTGGGHSDV